MKILKYLDFLLESRDEVVLPSILMRDFLNRIDKVDSPISTEFKKITTYTNPNYRLPHKWTFITTSESDDKVIFTESYKVKKWIQDNISENAFDVLKRMNTPSSDNQIVNLGENVGGSSRVEMKVGRFVKGYFGDKFSDKEIENFVNQWKSLDIKSTFEIWEGSDIINGYSSKNYHSNDYDNGFNPLMNSCMNDEPYVCFYQYCPDVKLLVLKDEDGDILGRSLIWKDVDGRNIMDRVYFVYDKDYFKFVRWANENNCWYKKNNTGLTKFIKDGKEEILNTKVRTMNVFDFPDEEYPYMDTFSFLQGDLAYNYQPSGNYWCFINTDGTYEVYDYGDEFEN